jgi:hypothetical protein
MNNNRNTIDESVRLKLKKKNDAAQGKSEILHCASLVIGVYFCRLFPTSDGFVAICKDKKDADKMLTTDSKKKLQDIGYDIVMPMDFRAKRTIFARQLDPHVGSNTSADLIKDIEARNLWAKVEDIIKFKDRTTGLDYTHVMKIIFTEAAMADRAIEGGLLTFGFSVTPSQIAGEVFTNVLTCFRCYKHGSHETKDCKLPIDTKLCSECGSDSHYWRDCAPNAVKKCLNCGGPHRTLAMMCPRKKEAINKKLNTERQTEQKRSTTTYANVAKETLKREGSQHTIVQLHSDLHVKIIICMLQAHLHNMAHPGEYGTMLNQMFRNNGIDQTIKVPDSPDSFKVFGALGPNVSVPGTENSDQDAENALSNDSVNTSSSKSNILSSTTHSIKSNVLSSTTSSIPHVLTTPIKLSEVEVEVKRARVAGALTRETERQRTIREALATTPELADDMNIQVYSTESLRGATTDDVRKLQKKKKLKIAFSALPNHNLTSADVRGLLLDGTIPLPDVAMVVSNMALDEYQKVVSGPIDEHARPLPQRVASSPKGRGS